MKNLRELFTMYPLGCESFGAEWLRRWNESARQEFYGDAAKWITWPDGYDAQPRTVGAALLDCADRVNKPENVRGFAAIRVVLLDGTVIKEWWPE